jgi:uncharacterized protein (TIGR02246 family)
VSASSPHEVSYQFADAINRGDLHAALALWAPGAAIVAADGGSVQGSEAIASVLGALIEHRTAVTIEVGSVYEAGAAAVATGTLTMTALDGSSQRSRAVVVYERAPDGGWRLAIDAPWGLPSAQADDRDGAADRGRGA